MKTATHTDYKKAAQKALLKDFGFKAQLKDIVLLEGGANSSFVDFVAFAINGKGYSWSWDTECIRNKDYDLSE